MHMKSGAYQTFKYLPTSLTTARRQRKKAVPGTPPLMIVGSMLGYLLHRVSNQINTCAWTACPLMAFDWALSNILPMSYRIR